MTPTDRRRSGAAGRLVAVALIASLVGCHQVLEPELHPGSKVPFAPPKLHILKAHMTSGELYVLDSWRVVADGRRLEGSGALSPSIVSSCRRGRLRSM